jgi:hypothetical protein
MERAEFAVGSVEVRGSGTIHRVLSFLGAFFLGIGPAAQPEREEENWWDRDVSSSNSADSVPMSLGHQAELFDHAGQVAVKPLERAVLPVADTWSIPETTSAAQAIPQTIVSVHSKSKVTARVVATTRVVPVTRVSSVAKTATVARGAVARQLIRSQSISSGREESRWFSVPQRVLLPRYQLFEGADAVTEDGGGLQIGSPSTRKQHGQVWFV